MTGPIVRVSRLTKVFKSYRREEGLGAALKSLVRRTATETSAVADVNFAIAPGEMVGYIGANGAGKSTTIKMLTGILTPTSGEILCNGFVPHRERTRYVATIGVVFGQRTQLWWDIAVVESFRLLKEIYGLTEAAVPRAHGPLRQGPRPQGLPHQPVRKLSLGERMRCDLAASLLHRPPLLFLDEPTIGLDIVAKANVREFLQEINSRDGHDGPPDDARPRRHRDALQARHRHRPRPPALRRRARRAARPDPARDLDRLRRQARPGRRRELSFNGRRSGRSDCSATGSTSTGAMVAPATAVKEIVNRFEVSDLKIEEPEIEEVVKRIYQEGIA